MTAMDDDFFVEDEPIEQVRAILARPADGVTTPPPARNLILPLSYQPGIVIRSRRDFGHTHHAAELLETA
jgi:hypothetical protein